jgi:streptogrisin C
MRVSRAGSLLHRGLAVAFCLGVLLPGTASAAVPAEDADVQALAAEQYASRFGVSEDVARSRLALQDRAAGIDDDLERKFARTYGGLWFDASDGGRMKVGVTGRGSVAKVQRALAARGLDEQTDVVPVRSTMAGLLRAHRLLDAKVGDLIDAGKVQTGVEPQLNAVVVKLASGVSAREKKRLRAEAAATSANVVLRSTHRSTLMAKPLACARPYCTTPLRGGVRIETLKWICTAGFIARSKTDNKPYVLTAGHCMDADAGTWSSIFPIGTRHSWEFGGVGGNGKDGDAGLLTVAPTSVWGAPGGVGPYVVVDSSATTTAEEQYRISSQASNAVGQSQCFTGSVKLTNGRYTACGTVIAVDQTANYGGGHIVNHLNEIRICGPVPGSSGGPYYKNHVAYGVESGQLIADPCDNFQQGVNRAGTDLNVNIQTG